MWLQNHVQEEDQEKYPIYKGGGILYIRGGGGGGGGGRQCGVCIVFELLLVVIARGKGGQ